MDGNRNQQSLYALHIRPLSEGKAVVFFGFLYVFGSLIWANIRGAATAGIRDDAILIGVLLLPFVVIIFRMLTRLLVAPWFTIVLVASLAVILAAASVALPGEAAVVMVYRTFPFAALGAALMGSLLACILNRPLTRAGLPSAILHAGLIIGLVGAFTSLLFRVNGYVSLREGETASRARLRNFRLSLTDHEGRTFSVEIPAQAARPDVSNPYAARMGEVVLNMLYDTGRGGGVLRVFAEKGPESDTLALRYGGPPGVLEVGESVYMVRFGPEEIELPFEVTLEQARVEFYPASRLPRRYHAEVTVRGRAGGVKRSGSLRVNHPLAVSGYLLLLNSVDARGAVLEVSRDPGARIVFAGGLIAVAGFAWGLFRRLGRTTCFAER